MFGFLERVFVVFKLAEIFRIVVVVGVVCCVVVVVRVVVVEVNTDAVVLEGEVVNDEAVLIQLLSGRR